MESILSPSIDIVLALLSTAILLAGMILLIDSIWRAEDRFDHYLKLMAVIFGVFFCKKTLVILGFGEFAYWSFLSSIIDLGMSTFFLMAQISLFTMIRSLSGESKDGEV